MEGYKTAIAYLRVSTTGQEKGTSPESQLESIKNFCMSKNILLLNVYFDKVSGKNFQRPKFQEAVKFLKENKKDINLFLTKRIDRFTRDTSSGLEAIKLINNLGVEVNYVDDWMDDINSPQGEMITTIKMAVSTYERKLINERTRLGTKMALRSGRYIKTPPRGYKMGKLANGKACIVPNEKSQLVKEMFEDYVTGIYSQKELLTKYKSKGLTLSKSALSRMLENVLYAGLVDLKKYDIEPHKLIKGLFEPIISEELFYNVQAIKSGRNRMIKKIRPKNEDFPLSSYLICAKCGSPMYGSTSNNGTKKKVTKYYSYYRCSKNCSNQSYTPELVHNELQKELTKAIPSKEISELFTMILKDEYSSTIQDTKVIVDNINTKLKSAEENQLLVIEKYALGKIKEEHYNLIMAKMEKELKELNIEKHKYKVDKDLEKYISFGMTLLMNMDKIYSQASVDTKVKLIGSYFDEKLIFENKKFRTPKFNEAIQLLGRYSKDFQTLEKKKGGLFPKTSHSVLEMGLEPIRPNGHKILRGK